MANMRKRRCSRSIGFYRDLNNLTTAWDECNSRITKRKTSEEIYGVEELVASRYNKSSREQEYLVKWKDWGSQFNSWEPESHILDKELIRKYRNSRNLETVLEQGAELIRNIVEGGLANSLQTEATVLLQHSIIREIFHKMDVIANQSSSLNARDFPLKYFPQGWDRAYTNKRGTLRGLLYPVHVRPFLSQSKQLFNEKGEKTKKRWMQKVTISFRKKNF